METTDILFALLRHAVCGEELNEQTIAACTPEKLEEVYALAKKHDLAHLVAYAVEGLQIPACEVTDKLKKAKMKAIYRYARLEYEFERICGVLEQAEIPFIPLKGSVLRKYYPESWMRTSCDIDVLVKPENLEVAVHSLEESCKYQRRGKGPHDVSMFAPTGVHFELHYDLIEDADSEQARAVLQQVWPTAVSQRKSAYAMTNDLFCFYHIAHMAKHFLHGGCGIRPFLDLWIWEREKKTIPTELLHLGGLMAFADACRKLARCWFSGMEMDEDTRNFANHVLHGGTHGSVDNRLQVEKATGQEQTLPLHRILIPYEDLRYYYPEVEGKKWRIPFYQILRWFRLAGNIPGLLRHRRIKADIPMEQEDAMARLIRYLALSKENL